MANERYHEVTAEVLVTMVRESGCDIQYVLSRVPCVGELIRMSHTYEVLKVLHLPAGGARSASAECLVCTVSDDIREPHVGAS